MGQGAHKVGALLALAVVALYAAQPSFAADCNANGIDDAEELAECPPIAVVFLMDTSHSMEYKIPLICPAITSALSDLAQSGLTVNSEILIIAPGGEDCPCCTGIVTVYGTTAPGLCDDEALGTCDSAERNREDWGPATAVVAANKNWGPGPRIVIPISDEGPRCGQSVDDDDRRVIDHTIPIAWEHRVIVSPIVEPGAVAGLAGTLAYGSAPGGAVMDISDPDLAANLADHIRSGFQPYTQKMWSESDFSPATCRAAVS